MYIRVYKGETPIDIIYFAEENEAIYEVNKLEKIGYKCEFI